MKYKKLVSLAYQTASKKAFEGLYPPEQRLFEDEFSLILLPTGLRLSTNMFKNKAMFNWVMKMADKIAPGIQEGLMCRVRYIDQNVVKAVDHGIEAVVNLGAGFDTRSLRMRELSPLKIFEVDHPAVITEKIRRFKQLKFENPEHLTYVPIDFNTLSLRQGLEKAGYDPSLKTLFIWEGVTNYISKEAVESTLKYISGTKNGSRVVFTYMPQDFFDRPELYPEYERMRATARKMGYSWITGLDPETMDKYLDSLGLKLLEDVGADHYRENFLKPLNRGSIVMRIERAALAEV